MPRGLMSKDTFNLVLAELKANVDLVRVVVLYHGGEPLLNKNFFWMCEAVRGVSPTLKLKTVTNGMALNERVVSKLVSCGLDSIEISLDGSSAGESEAIRSGSSTRQIIDGVKCLLNSRDGHSPNLAVVISTTQFVKFQSRDQVFEDLIPTVPSWLIDEFGSRVDYNPTFGMKWPANFDYKDFDVIYGDGVDKNFCDHVNSTLTIRADGKVVACCYDLTSELVMGDISHNSIVDIFNGSKYAELRKSIANRDYNSFCRECNVVRPPAYLVRKSRSSSNRL